MGNKRFKITLEQFDQEPFTYYRTLDDIMMPDDPLELLAMIRANALDNRYVEVEPGLLLSVNRVYVTLSITCNKEMAAEFSLMTLGSTGHVECSNEEDDWEESVDLNNIDHLRGREDIVALQMLPFMAKVMNHMTGGFPDERSYVAVRKRKNVIYVEIAVQHEWENDFIQKRLAQPSLIREDIDYLFATHLPWELY